MRVVVVGGGPVGLFAGTLASQRGHDVVVLERRDGDGDKACGEGLMPSAVAALKGVGARPRGAAFRGIRYVDATGRHQVRTDLPGGAGLGVRRTELVRSLRACAEDAEVELVRAEVEEVRAGPDRAVVETASGRWVGDLVLGCDGLASTVRSKVGLEGQVAGLRRYGLVAHFAMAPWSDDVEVYWGALGEAYVTPLGERLVGVAMLGRRGGSFERRVADLPALASRLDGQERVGRVLGAGPLRRKATSPVRGAVALVGDAAGYVDALTGEGLAVGFRSAQAVVAAAESGHLESYRAALSSIRRRPDILTDVLVRSTSRPPMRRVLVPAAAEAPRLFGRAVALLD
jgi:flavin-dependent dehydrogenase